MLCLIFFYNVDRGQHMKKLILIAGDLAAGKSTLADNLSSRLGIMCLKKDNVKESLCDIFGYRNREENLKLSKAAMDQMILVLKQTVKVNGDIILESNFHSEELTEIYKLCRENGYNACLLLLTGDKKILYERFMARVPTRHKAHMSQKLNESFESFSDYIDTLRAAKFVFPIHKIDATSMTIEEVTELALSHCKSYGIV